ncbi:MAG: FtsX-like permease family protein [Spartobacteria bacterium]
MKGIAARLEKAYPATNAQVGVVVTPLLENLVGKYRTNLTILLGAVGLVLLIACANLANLFAARGAARAREFAIRAAVGANRGHIIRQLLVESFVDRHLPRKFIVRVGDHENAQRFFHSKNPTQRTQRGL